MLMFLTLIDNPDDCDFITEIYADYYGVMRKNVLKLSRNSDIVEDLIHDAMVCLIKKCETLKKLNKPARTSYILQTIRNTTINHLCRQATRANHSFLGFENDLAEDFGDNSNNPIDQVIKHEMFSHLGDVIMELPNKERNVLYCKYMMQMKTCDLVPMFGFKNQDVVRTFLSRARKHALEKLKERGVTND